MNNTTEQGSALMIGQKCPACSNGFMRLESYNIQGVEHYELVCDGLIYSSNERQLPVACEHTIFLSTSLTIIK